MKRRLMALLMAGVLAMTGTVSLSAADLAEENVLAEAEETVLEEDEQADAAEATGEQAAADAQTGINTADAEAVADTGAAPAGDLIDAEDLIEDDEDVISDSQPAAEAPETATEETAQTEVTDATAGEAEVATEATEATEAAAEETAEVTTDGAADETIDAEDATEAEAATEAATEALTEAEEELLVDELLEEGEEEETELEAEEDAEAAKIAELLDGIQASFDEHMAELEAKFPVSFSELNGLLANSSTTEGYAQYVLQQHMLNKGYTSGSEKYIYIQDTLKDGTVAKVYIYYNTSTKKYRFIYTEANGKIGLKIEMGPATLTNLSSSLYPVSTVTYNGATVLTVILNMYSPNAYTGNSELTGSVEYNNTGYTTSEAKELANEMLRRLFLASNILLGNQVHVSMVTIGFDAYVTSHTHSYKDIVSPKATNTADGAIYRVCTACSNIASVTTIPRISTVTLSATSFAYNGAVQRPSVIVRDRTGAVIPASNYTLKWSNPNSSAVGTYTVQIVMNGVKYSGTYGNYTYKINVTYPILLATYNGAYGIGIKWRIVPGATSYDIYRKYKGVWARIDTVSPYDSSLQRSGNTLMYTDRSVQKKYGEGYIYSVAATVGGRSTGYNRTGLAAYRLKNPTLSSVTKSGSKVIVKWNKVPCQGYELQVAHYTDTSTWYKYTPSPQNATSGYFARSQWPCGSGKYYIRIRCQKTNKDRGTTWSEYSPWKSVTIN